MSHERHANCLPVLWHLEHLPRNLLFRPRSRSILLNFPILLHVRTAPSLLVLHPLTLKSVGCFGLGFILDMKSLSQRQRARLGLFVVVLLNLGVYIWSIIMQTKFNAHSPGRIDWDDSLYPSAFLPYFFVQTTGPLSQSYMYWLLSSFATDAQANVRNGAAFRCLEAVGQAISYGMNTQTEASPLIGMGVSFGLMALATAPMVLLTSKTPDRIPADVILEGQEAGDAKIGYEPEVVTGKVDQK